METRNGKVKVVEHDIKLSYKTKDSLAMLKLLAMTNEENTDVKGIKEAS